MTLTLVVTVILFLSYQIYWPVRTLEYEKPYLTVENGTPEAGDVLMLGISYCKYTDLGEIVSARMRSQDDDRIENFLVSVTGETAVYRGLESGCHTIHSAIWTIPKAAIPCHTYRAYFDILYQPNAFQRIIRHSVTEPFYLKGGTC